MKLRVVCIILILLATGGAAAFRLPELALRPMHLDEAVHAYKLGQMIEKGHREYRYNPVDYHGPTLHYLALPAVWLRGITRYADLDEQALRIVPAVFGVLMVLLVLGLGDGLGWPAAACAAALTAVSAALVFYSRYYIMEVLLVCFTFLAMVGAWRFIKGGSWAWCIVAAVGAGLAMATKETWVLCVAAAAAGVLVNAAWGRWVTGAPVRLAVHVANRRAAAGVALALAVAALFFSSFLTNARGPLDAVLTYFHGLVRAGGGGASHVSGSLHLNPWDFYLRRLVYYRCGRGPVWTDALVVGLALAGTVAGFAQRGLGRGDAKCVRFLAVYGLVLTAIYTVLPYKTPWCILGALHALVLVAGVGAVALVRWVPTRPAKAVVVLLLAAGAAQLGWQAYRANFKLYDSNYNPWVYGHTLRDTVRLGRQMEDLAAVSPAGLNMTIKVFAPDIHDYWPLPWYFRRFNQRRVGFFDRLPPDCDADAIVFVPEVWDELRARLREKYEYPWRRGLRPALVLVVGVREDLWKRYMDRIRAAQAARKAP